ncbi:ABC transporter permease protein [Minicystis rosea]|nr:ABC transporter permease protein [Minicystis rosea]
MREGFLALSEGLVQLRGSPLRTGLTLLGVVFGVGSVVSMVSIGEGAQRQILSSIEAMGATSLQVQSAVSKDQSLADLVNVSVGLSQTDALALEKALGVEQAVAARAVYAPKVSNLPLPTGELRVVGVTASVFDQSRLRMQSGRRLSIWDERQASATVVLGSALAHRIFTGDPVGRWIRLDYAWFQVVGVLAPQEGGAADGPSDVGYDKSIILPYPALRELLEPPRTYGDLDRISIRMATIEDTLPAKRVADRLLSNLHGGATDFEVISPEELLQKRKETQYVMTAVLTAIAAISLLVGGIGVMNIMLANVSERVAEIGVRRAIGATRRDVLIQFLIESTTICVIGGAIGAVLGLVAALVATQIMGLPVVFAWQALVLAVVISVVVGVASGLIPAKRAADLNPIEALRGE